ncbi:hypothetical protein GOP47_0022392 [Adiantum capillus-veneris]|uniref:Uncharacterized protein n=1 Tax=Adiantum capillus-veneris TaxID=13818 RepID=A0A9D4Z477_ADICA|nr:hypothetical protein GOP47_0022392 [Adiantum capillus-veneris]
MESQVQKSHHQKMGSRGSPPINEKPLMPPKTTSFATTCCLCRKPPYRTSNKRLTVAIAPPRTFQSARDCSQDLTTKKNMALWEPHPDKELPRVPHTSLYHMRRVPSQE